MIDFPGAVEMDRAGVRFVSGHGTSVPIEGIVRLFPTNAR